MLELGLSLVFAYLIGSINFSLALGRLRNLDVRETGSGNAGATNALRAAGFWFALAVMIGDVGKAILVVGPLASLAYSFAEQPTFSLAWVQVAAGASVTAAHCYPLWHEFRGGKGFATLLGSYLVLHAPLVGAVLAVWVLVMIFSGYVGLATMVAAVSAPLFLAFFMPEAPPELFWLAAAAGAFTVSTHRSNIRNLLDGSEHCFERVRIDHWFKSGG